MGTTPTRSIAGAALAAVLAATTALQAPPAHADPPPTIRVPHLAEPGAVPPAVVASQESLAGVGYTVSEGGEVVASGTLAPLSASPAPWSHAALADLGAIDEPGTYTITVGAVTSTPFTVSADAWTEVLESLLGIYDANADGDEPSSYHGPSHLNDARSRIRNGPHKGERIDVEGGWMDAGDQLKFTTTTAYSSLMLELAARNEPSMAEELESASDVGIRWLLKAHPRKGVFAAMVGDEGADHGAGFRDPTVDDTSDDPLRRRRPTEVLTPATGGSDVAGMAAAALATASERMRPRKRDRLLTEARAWLRLATGLDAVWENCCYRQASHHDDIALAWAALWRATGQEAHARRALRALRAALDDGEGGVANWRVGADGFEMAGIAAAELCGVLGGDPAPGATGEEACALLRDGGWAWIHVATTDTAFGRAGWNQWGAVRQNESGAVVLELAERAGNAEAAAAADRAAGWFLGVNQWGLRWQAGVAGGIEHPYHWAQLTGPAIPHGAVPGGPTRLATINENRCAECPEVVPGVHDTVVETYQDLARDWVMNEVGINYNAPAVLHFALLSDG